MKVSLNWTKYLRAAELNLWKTEFKNLKRQGLFKLAAFFWIIFPLLNTLSQTGQPLVCYSVNFETNIFETTLDKCTERLQKKLFIQLQIILAIKQTLHVKK